MAKNYDFPVDKNVPRPRSRHKYPWPDMQVNDSVLIPADRADSASTSAYHYGKKHGRKFEQHLSSKGLRIWRVK